MTTSAKSQPNWFIAIGVPFLLCLACFIITTTTKFRNNTSILSNGILADLLITVPLIYFLAIRKSSIPKITIVPVFLAGFFVATFILDAHSVIALHLVKSIAPALIEGFVIYFVARRFYVANKEAKKNQEGKIDFLVHSRKVMTQVTGSAKIGNIMTSEIAVFYYSFFGRKDKTIDFKKTFSGYRENGLLILLSTILGLFIIETAGTHLLIRIWSETWAWIITILSFYTCLQLFGHIRAIKARPIVINKDSLEIHNGLAGDAIIKFDNIEKFELSKKLSTNKKAVKIALINGLENHNIVVHLKEPIVVTKIFGIKKTTDTVLFFVDKPKEFCSALNAALI